MSVLGTEIEGYCKYVDERNKQALMEMSKEQLVSIIIQLEELCRPEEGDVDYGDAPEGKAERRKDLNEFRLFLIKKRAFRIPENYVDEYIEGKRFKGKCPDYDPRKCDTKLGVYTCWDTPEHRKYLCPIMIIEE